MSFHGPCRALAAGLFVLSPTFTGIALAAGLPRFDIKKSCADAKEFSKDFQSNNDYQSCLADEKRARDKLAKNWSSFSASQRRECLEPGPDPSYVETLTCLQMDKNNASGSDVGGPIAPGVKFDK